MTEKQVHRLVIQTLQWLKKNKYSWIDVYKMADTITAICYIESKFDPKAKNKYSSAKGLMQMTDPAKSDAERWLNLPTAPSSKMYNPEYNLKLGITYFLYQYKRYNFDLNKSIIAYNQGFYNPNTDGISYLNKYNSAFKEFNKDYLASINPLQVALLLSLAVGTYYYMKK